MNRTGDTSGLASVNFAVSGSGTNPANAADFGGALPSGSVNFAANETTKTITVNVSGDTLAENDEGFKVTLSKATNAMFDPAATVATGTIQNDD